MTGSILTHKNLTDELIRISSLLVTYVKIAADAGFNDNYAALEEFIKTYYEIVEKYVLTNTNSIKRNYPAIDLVDDARKVAIQVTATAKTGKINKTLAQWVALNKGDYKLIIVGVTAKVKSTKADVYTFAELIGETKNLNLNDLQQLLTAFKSRISPNTYSLTTDEACLGNLIDYLNRGALRHMQDHEGSYQNMYASLEEVKKFILSGSVKGYPISIKPLSMYSDSTKNTLREIEYRITDILSICDRHRSMDGNISMGQHEYDRIDELKMQIAHFVDEIKRGLNSTS